jgi:intraflagellar transport protein 140
MKTIINFYTRARSHESLSNFYVELSQLEIDEFTAYEKALQAMMEAKNHLEKSDAANKQVKLSMLLNKIKYLEQFCDARNAQKQGNDE